MRFQFHEEFPLYSFLYYVNPNTFCIKIFGDQWCNSSSYPMHHLLLVNLNLKLVVKHDIVGNQTFSVIHIMHIYTYIPVYLYKFILLKMRTYRWANKRKSLMKRNFSFSLLIPEIKIISLPLLCSVIFCITSLKRPKKICASVAMTITVYHIPNIKHPGIILIFSHWVTDTKNKRIC